MYEYMRTHSSQGMYPGFLSLRLDLYIDILLLCIYVNKVPVSSPFPIEETRAGECDDKSSSASSMG